MKVFYIIKPQLRNYLKTLYDISESDSNLDKVAYMLEHDYAVEEFDAPELDVNGKQIGNELDVTRYYNYFISRVANQSDISQIIKSIIIQLTNDKLNYWKKDFFEEKRTITQTDIDADIASTNELLKLYFDKYNSPRIPPITNLIPQNIIDTIINELVRRYIEMLNISTPVYMPFGKNLKSKIKQINRDIKYLSK